MQSAERREGVELGVRKVKVEVEVDTFKRWEAGTGCPEVGQDIAWHSDLGVHALI